MLLLALLIRNVGSDMAYRQTATIQAHADTEYLASYIVNNQFTYEEARRGEAIATIQADYLSDGINKVGRSIYQFDYYVYTAGLVFSVASIPADAVIKDVKVTINFTAFPPTGTDYVDIFLIQYDWGGGALAPADWINLDTLNNPDTYPILGSRNTKFFIDPSVASPSFLSTKAMIDYVQSLVGGSDPIRIYMVGKNDLYDIVTDFYFRGVRGLPAISGDPIEEDAYLSFLDSSVSIEIIYEQP